MLDIYEQHFNAYFVGTAEQYLKSKNIHTPRCNPQSTALTDMPLLNECQKSKVAPETYVAHLQEECTQLTRESSSEEELPIEMRGNVFDEELQLCLNSGIIEDQIEKKIIPPEDIMPCTPLMYEEYPIVDNVGLKISNVKNILKNINQVRMDTAVEPISVGRDR